MCESERATSFSVGDCGISCANHSNICNIDNSDNSSYKTIAELEEEERWATTEYTNTDAVSFESHDVEWCRRRPTWRDDGEDVRERCQEVLRYVPPDPEQLTSEFQGILSSNYDPATGLGTDEGYDVLPVLERPIFRILSACMEKELATTVGGATTGTLITPSIDRYWRRQHDGLVMMAVVRNALCEEEAAAVEALTACLMEHVPDAFDHRDFYHTDEGGGNDTTFLAGYLQMLAPGVAARTHGNAQLVWENVGWKDDADTTYEPVDLHYYDPDFEERDEPDTTEYSRRWLPDPAHMGIRTSEHLSYDRWGVLGYHQDAGSDYTVLAALSDPAAYEGGAFSLCPHTEFTEGIHHKDGLGRRRLSAIAGKDGKDCTAIITVKPERLSAIVFLSLFSHGVGDILTPGRIMFTNEFWRYENVPATVQRPGIKEFVLELNEDDDDLFYDVDDDDDDDNDEDDDEDDDDDDDDENED